MAQPVTVTASSAPASDAPASDAPVSDAPASDAPIVAASPPASPPAPPADDAPLPWDAQRPAREPFVFRTGRLRGRAAAHSIAEAVAYMDRHPADGIFHLRNGTLARWLEEEGADDLAALARTALYQGQADRRAGLEWFLVATGLAPRPQLALRPPHLDLGYVVAGERAAATLRIGKGRGRGYLYGTIRASEAWVNPLPRAFAGGAPVSVSVETETLPIQHAPHTAQLFIESNATPEPVAVPVTVRVTASPARSHRWGLRPLAALALAALPGALIGGLLAADGVRGAWWGVAVAVVWAVCGLARGLWQPPAWPVGYAARRWLLPVGGWAVGLLIGGLALAAYWAAATGGPPALPLPRLALWMLALSALPGTYQAIRRTRPPVVHPPAARGALTTPTRRRAAGIAAVVVLAALLVVPFAAQPLWRAYQRNGAIAAAQARTLAAWDGLNAQVNHWIDQVYLYYYDRRAPSGGDTP